MGKKGFHVREGTAVTRSLLSFRRIDQIGKYIRDNRSLVPYCPRGELQIGKGRKQIGRENELCSVGMGQLSGV